jgi:chlorophyll synthase
MRTFVDIVFAARPLLLIPVWTILIAGVIRARDLTGHAGLPIWPELVLFSLLASSVHLIGLVVDVGSDVINEKLPYVAGSVVSARSALFGAGLFAATAFLFAIVSVMTVVEFSVTALLAGLLAYLLGLCYVLPPVRLKGRPPFDLILHMFGYGTLLFSVGWLSQTSAARTSMVLGSIPYAASVGFIYVLTAGIDWKGDEATGTFTIASWGRRVCGLLCFALLLVAVASSLLLGDYLVLIASITAAFFFLLSRFLTSSISHIRVCKISVLALALVVSAIYPVLLFLLAGSVILARIYHAKRLRLSYPSTI